MTPEQFLEYLKNRIDGLEAAVVETKAVIAELYSVMVIAERVVDTQKSKEATT